MRMHVDHWPKRTVSATGGALIGLLLLVIATPPAADAYPRPGATERVSVSSTGREVKDTDGWPFPVVTHCTPICKNALSANGRFVAFESPASDLVGNDNNRSVDIFVRDLHTNRTARASISGSGAEAVGFCTPSGFSGDPTQLPGALAGSYEPSISASGRYVVFSSCAANLVTTDLKHTQDVFVHDRKTGQTKLVSASADGTPAVCVGGAGCSRVSTKAVSADGRYVTFYSTAPNLVANDTNSAGDAFVKNLRTGAIERVSISSEGSQAEFGISNFPVISANGRYVAFRSGSDNLVANDRNVADIGDVFVHDRKKDTTELINVTPDGIQEITIVLRDFMVFTPGQLALSRNGRYVGFASRWGGFVPNDSNDTFDIFVHDRKTRALERVSVLSDGREGAAFSEDNMTFSNNGRFVAFWTESRLAPDDADGGTCKNPFDITSLCISNSKDVYVYDRHTGATDLVSRGFDGTARDCKSTGCSSHGSTWPSLDASGRLVAFHSHADRLVRDDGNVLADNFVRDRGGDLTVSLSRSADTPASLVWLADASGDVDGAAAELGADLVGARLAVRPRLRDLFVRVDVAQLPGITATGVVGDPSLVYVVRFRAAGKTYEVRAASAGLVARFALFRCDDDEKTCEKTADLTGGYGTIGSAVVTAVPLTAIGLGGGGLVSAPVASTARGSLELGPVDVLDTTPN